MSEFRRLVFFKLIRLLSSALMRENVKDLHMQLENKVALITGASSGIGAATAKLFAAQGAKVILGARRKPELNDVAQKIEQNGGTAIAIVGDVQDEQYSQTLVDAAVEQFGGLDIAFNNAGTLGALGDLPSIKGADWDATIRTNLTSGFYGAKYQLPALQNRGGGSLIFTSTFVGYTVGLPGMAAYAASKAGLIGMAQCLAAEYGPQNIRVNALLPGGTNTRMAPDRATDPESYDAIASFHALKRIADPEEIANAALFLASDSSSFVTGSAMLVDGGNSILKA